MFEFVKAILTSPIGKYIHPFFMTFIAVGWISTAILGFLARKARLQPSTGTSQPLIRNRTQRLREARLHQKLSSTLFFLTVFFAMLAMLYNYLTAGVLFPGQHLFGAFGFILIASLNVWIAPFMGMIEPLRILHAIVGVVALGFLFNQVISGGAIVKSWFA